MSLAYLLNTAWAFSCRKSLKELSRQSNEVETVQQGLLANMVGDNAATEFGHHHRFDKIRDADDYRAAVSIGDGDSFQPWIRRICDGEQNVLTTDVVRLLEPTSGTTGGRKLIPYTDSLKRQFRAGIDAWIGDLFLNRPALRHGRSYWSVTPVLQDQQTGGGLRIGFDDDTEYLGLAGRLAARKILAVRKPQLQNSEPEEVLRETTRLLLDVDDLTLISVWSPTFLLAMCNHLEHDANWFIERLNEHANTPRRRQARRILDSSEAIKHKIATLWPKLGLVSCWCDGPSSGFAQQLSRVLPETVEIQPKGLLSTEAFVTLPLLGSEGGVLSVRSHFFEFCPPGRRSDATLLAHELTFGQRYQVVVTTAGGLYRYRTGDVVEVVGFLNQAPQLRFIGRDGRVSDLVGEKLSEAFVAVAIKNAMQALNLKPTYACLVPQRHPCPKYRLLLDCEGVRNAQMNQLSNAVERELCKNPYYDQAIRIGQLDRLEVCVSDQSGPSHWQVYESQCLSKGCRRGDIKPLALDTAGVD